MRRRGQPGRVGALGVKSGSLALLMTAACAQGDGSVESTPGPGSLGQQTTSATGPASSGPSSSNGNGTNSSSDDPGTSSAGGSDGPGTSGSDTNPTSPATETGSDSDPTLTGGGGPCVLANDCDDADACTEDNCVNSQCQHALRDCDDGLACTNDSCNPTNGVCENVPDDSNCDDGDACSGVAVCDPVADCVAGEPVICADANACTTDTCLPATGSCDFAPIAACTSGDGCCPAGCSAADSDCVCSNLATGATPASSGGGNDGAGYGPANWNDGAGGDACNADCSNCTYGWIANSGAPDGAFMQYTWPAEITIGSMQIDTTSAGTPCFSQGRNMVSGRIQWWDGAAWIDAETWAGATGDLSFNFDPPLSTTRVRLFDVTSVGGQFGNNSLMFEWSIYTPIGCP